MRNARFAAHNYERARKTRGRMVGGEREKAGRERKPGYRNYCGSETCATAAYLNEDRENGGRQVGEGKEWRRDRENEKEGGDGREKEMAREK